ncbi:two-component system, LuxR family, sensor kinase FixL [Methylobacterium phyllostachyos]|uniref:Two-component system, LuxR family, sensor kinase FixL n=1 Tax=Methylobacterium phyllostachyos TaxID=582672 RepID=A0A1H0BFP2_9HYPH|nr:PAS domain-containing protein [Methylobacterium phyllostachyos]SDN44441.1 two-component system, LuxR family, sensor kinase FixL [Methylobacterium phyllostachyos]
MDEAADDVVSEAALIAALENSGGVGFWMWDIRKDEARADPVSALLFNISPARSRAGVSLSEILAAIHSDDQPHISQAILDCVQSGSSYTAEYRVCSPAGRLRWLFTRGHFYLDAEGQPTTGRGVIVEISDSKSAGTAFAQREGDSLDALNRTADLCLSLHNAVSDLDDAPMLALTEALLLEIGRHLAARQRVTHGSALH